MNLTPTTPAETPIRDSYIVEFYPSLDDFVHIATRISNSVPAASWTVYSYYVFLLLNSIVFPAFLWINDYFLAGIMVFVINLLALTIIIPRVNSDGFRNYYRKIIGNRENEIARVELTHEGAIYTSDGGESFWPWRRITSVEETSESIYFFFDGNGFAVRKNGFAYQSEERNFFDFATQRILGGRAKEIEG